MPTDRPPQSELSKQKAEPKKRRVCARCGYAKLTVPCDAHVVDYVPRKRKAKAHAD